MKRGEIWMVDFGPPTGPEQSGVRPDIVIQDDTLSESLETTIVVPLTTKVRRLGIETTLLLSAGEASLPQDSVALCHQIQVRGRARLLSKVGTLTESRRAEVIEKVLQALSL